MLPKSKPVFDKYHLNKAIMTSTGSQPERRKEMHQILEKTDKDSFKAIIKEMSQDAKSKNEQKKTKEFRRYVLNNWDGIEIHKAEECGGSSAEAHVSHVLSARLSSRPMAWSREGLKCMAELRAYRANGGVVGIEQLRVKQSDNSLVKKAMKRAQKAFSGINVDTLGNISQ